MIIKDLYYLAKSEFSEGRILAEFRLNPQHEIFDGHFPGQPVLPGVCLIQIIKEILEGKLSQRIMLIKSNSIKFISPVVPEINTELNVILVIKSINDEYIKIESVISGDSIVFMKFKGEYQIVT